MKSLNGRFILVAGILATSGLMASAIPQVRLSDGVTNIVVVDQSPEDINPVLGAVSYSGPVGSVWVQSLATGVSKPVVGSDVFPVLDLNSLAVSSEGAAGILTIELTDIGFTANGDFNASVGGTTEGQVSFATWIDAGNAPFAKTTPVTSQGPFPGPAFGQNVASTLSGTPLYSVTLQVTIQHPGNPGPGGELSGLDAFVYITPAPEKHGGCRTTGGGRQAASFPQVAYVTHGGQLGAPVGNETAFDPDTKCIHGNWQHVRHMKGGLRGNFHAKSFDSLMCACLGCPEDPNAGFIMGGLCNPDMRTCGPEPRKAPANKIAFSGVGDYALNRGKRERRAVLFRVDVEDRSEPGNSGAKVNSSAKARTAPADRHRIRIWILTEAELARLNDPNDRLLDFRQAISAQHGLVLKDGAILPDGNAVPNGTPVFGVRGPDIDDGGEMTHGNHQLHPSIKSCPN